MGTLKAKDGFDLSGRGVGSVWRYQITEADFTDAVNTVETLTLSPLVATDQTQSTAGAIITDAFVLIETPFAGPTAVRITIALGDLTNGAAAYLEAVEVHAAGHGPAGLKGDTPNEKGDRLIGATSRQAGGTIFLDENDAMTVSIDTTGTDATAALTAGVATLCVTYIEIPEPA